MGVARYKGDKISPKMALFLQEYIVDLNGRDAYIRAGFAVNGAQQNAYDLLHMPIIKAALQELMDARARRIQINQDMVLSELASIGFANMGDFVKINEDGSGVLDLSNVTREQMAAVKEFSVDTYVDRSKGAPQRVKTMKITLSDKQAALVNIGKHLGMFKDNLNVTGGINITISSVDADL